MLLCVLLLLLHLLRCCNNGIVQVVEVIGVGILLSTDQIVVTNNVVMRNLICSNGSFVCVPNVTNEKYCEKDVGTSQRRKEL